MNFHDFFKRKLITVLIKFSVLYLKLKIYLLGYGDIVCRSDLGKIVTMIYALISIPVCTAALVYASDIVVCLVQLAIILVEHQFLRRPRIVGFQRKRIIIQAVLLLSTFAINCKIGYPYIVSTEDPSAKVGILDTIYFVFITATTIGFGDYVFDFGRIFTRPKSVIEIIGIIYNMLNSYILLGLVAAFINLLSNLKTPKKKKGKNSHKVDVKE